MSWCAGDGDFNPMGCDHAAVYCEECHKVRVGRAVAAAKEPLEKRLAECERQLKDAERRLGEIVSKRTREVLQ